MQPPAKVAQQQRSPIPAAPTREVEHSLQSSHACQPTRAPPRAIGKPILLTRIGRESRGERHPSLSHQLQHVPAEPARRSQRETRRADQLQHRAALRPMRSRFRDRGVRLAAGLTRLLMPPLRLLRLGRLLRLLRFVRSWMPHRWFPRFLRLTRSRGPARRPARAGRHRLIVARLIVYVALAPHHATRLSRCWPTVTARVAAVR